MGPVGHSGTYKEFDLGFLLESALAAEQHQMTEAPIEAFDTPVVGAFSEHIAKLGRQSPSGRLQMLNEFTNPQGIAALAATVQNKSEILENRRGACWALGNLKTDISSALPALVGALKDQDWAVRSYAVTALGRMGPKAQAALPALRHALNDRDALVREEVPRAMARIRRN